MIFPRLTIPDIDNIIACNRLSLYILTGSGPYRETSGSVEARTRYHSRIIGTDYGKLGIGIYDHHTDAPSSAQYSSPAASGHLGSVTNWQPVFTANPHSWCTPHPKQIHSSLFQLRCTTWICRGRLLEWTVPQRIICILFDGTRVDQEFQHGFVAKRQNTRHFQTHCVSEFKWMDQCPSFESNIFLYSWNPVEQYPKAGKHFLLDRVLLHCS